MTDLVDQSARSFLFDHVYPTVKTEEFSSPDLSSSTPPSLCQLQYKFQSPHSVSSHASRSSDQLASQSIYRFGANNPYNFVPPWFNSHPSTPGPPSLPPTMSSGSSRYDMGSSHQPFPYAEDYDDVDLGDVSLSTRSPSSLADLSASAAEKTVRRRSSKACDQCRKSKCKCERTASGDPCKSCIMLGVQCTFLGPSRKRGPPKGYIDAIEARLHQTEALLGIIISSNDVRAQTLLRDLAKDSLAREIIDRVDNSPYGVKGRKREDGACSTAPKTRFGHITAASNPDGDTEEGEDAPKLDLTSTHPSNEWQDKVTTMLSSLQSEPPKSDCHSASQRPSLRLDVPQDGSRSPRQRQRRKLESDNDHRYSPPSAISSRQPESLSTYSSLSSSRFDHLDHPAKSSSATTTDDDENDGELTGAVGQLSLNEEAQVRYHGKSSGLYLLSDKVKVENRNEGGLWRFPKARVWPALPSGANAACSEAESKVPLPNLAIQEHLLDLYFMYVHPNFPVIHKDGFFDAFKHGEPSNATTTSGEDSRFRSPLIRGRRSIPSLLLFAMFSIAARYEDVDGVCPAPPSDPTTMWVAGDEYLDSAKQILDGNYATSRPSTCQALLLLGFREIGIGAMAQAWTYIGMAIRMAQDLGIHRCADKWARADLGGKLFGEWELNERKRIWYGCVIMDKYVSTYIGRPLMIFEQDFDALLPNESDPEEWTPCEFRARSSESLPVPSRVISCFNASATLSNILGKIVDEIYAVRPQLNRQAVLPKLEGLLDKWYHELPEHLRFDPSSANARQKTVLPHVLTLHMQYWCAVLLLHRAFIQLSPEYHHDDTDSRASAVKNNELCAGAANHITALGSLYHDRFSLKKSPVFLSYYVFSASVMHASRLSMLPDDPQASVGLTRSMHILNEMQVVWPSAGRALELMNAAKASLKEGKLHMPLRNQHERAKRSAADMEDHPPTQAGPSRQQQPAAVHHRADLIMSYDMNVYNPGNFSVQPLQHSNSTSTMETEIESQPLMDPYTTFERWMPPMAHAVVPSSGALSTSMLPQLYSTGLVEESTFAEGHRMSSNTNGHGGSVPHGHRHQQYWDNYPQLDTTYGELEPIPQHPGPAPQQQMYMSGHYGLYS